MTNLPSSTIRRSCHQVSSRSAPPTKCLPQPSSILITSATLKSPRCNLVSSTSPLTMRFSRAIRRKEQAATTSRASTRRTRRISRLRRVQKPARTRREKSTRTKAINQEEQEHSRTCCSQAFHHRNTNDQINKSNTTLKPIRIQVLRAKAISSSATRTVPTTRLSLPRLPRQ